MKEDRIVVTGGVLLGKSRIKGTRIGVEQILQCLAEGWSYEKIIEEFNVSSGDIQACTKQD